MSFFAAHLPHPTRLAAAPRAASPEHTRVLGATGPIVLHVADDELVSAQPGTPATSHLSAGLVPVAVAVAGVILSPRG